MKFFKITLLIMAMCMMQPACARIRGAAGNAQPPTRPIKTIPTPAPIAPAPAGIVPKSFQSFMQQIRDMNSEKVIDDRGMFTNTFMTFVQSSNLAPLAMETLMQAGRNLHLPLSDDSKQDIALTVHAGKNISNFMTAMALPIPSANTPKDKPVIENPIKLPIPAQQDSSLTYAEQTSQQFTNLLKPYFVPSSNRNKTIGQFVDHDKKFTNVLDTLIDHMRTAYPKISLDNLRIAVTTIVFNGMNYDGLVNGKSLIELIDKYINRPSSPAKADVVPSLPVTNKNNKPADPLDYANLLVNKFTDEIKLFFIKNHQGQTEFGRNTGDFPIFARKIAALMFKEYPQISLQDLTTSVEIVMALDQSAKGMVNFKQLQNYIKQIVTNQYNSLQQNNSSVKAQADNLPQPQQQQRPQVPNLNMQEDQKKDALLSKFRREVRTLVANKYRDQLKEFFEQKTATKAVFAVQGREDQFKRLIQQIMRDVELIPKDPMLTKKETNTGIRMEILNTFSDNVAYTITNEPVLLNLLESIIMD